MRLKPVHHRVRAWRRLRAKRTAQASDLPRVEPERSQRVWSLLLPPSLFSPRNESRRQRAGGFRSNPNCCRRPTKPSSVTSSARP
jgi:hypothetical protein